eukprot:jgi/Mesvir1/26968/Mv25917-RA.1
MHRSPRWPTYAQVPVASRCPCATMGKHRGAAQGRNNRATQVSTGQQKGEAPPRMREGQQANTQVVQGPAQLPAVDSGRSEQMQELVSVGPCVCVCRRVCGGGGAPSGVHYAQAQQDFSPEWAHQRGQAV